MLDLRNNGGGLLDGLAAHGLGPQVQIDLGIVRGLAYYTGFVFEAFQTAGTGRALAGGGRYDHLVEKLGGPSLPAVGFGLGDVVIADLLDDLQRWPNWEPRLDVQFAPLSEAALVVAVSLAATLRKDGWRVEVPLRPVSPGKALKQAAQAGTRWAVILGDDELATHTATVRNLITTSEHRVPQEGIAEALQGQDAVASPAVAPSE